jgi:hypothetical protein
MPRHTSIASLVPFVVAQGQAGETCRCRDEAGAQHECVRDMDRRIAEAVLAGGLTRGAALALYGEVVETHPDDPCSARQLLTRSLGDLVPA